MDIYNKSLIKSFKLHLANHFQAAPGRDIWGPRTIEDYELIYLISGKGGISYDNIKNIIIRPNEVLLIPPGRVHIFSADSFDKTILSCIHFSFVPSYADFSFDVFYASHDMEILHLFKKSADEFTNNGVNYKSILDCTIGEIWHRLMRVNMQSIKSHEPAKLTHARRFIEKNHANPITRLDIADHLDITPEHLNFLFRKYTDTTPIDYLTQIRIQAARELLKSANVNISEVAYRTGFDDPLYFSRVFKKLNGIPPRQYANSL